MLTVADLVASRHAIAAMPRLPCGVMVQPEGYHELRQRLSEIEPSDPGPFTPQLEVVVSRMSFWPGAQKDEVLLVYNPALLRALVACEEKAGKGGSREDEA